MTFAKSQTLIIVDRGRGMLSIDIPTIWRMVSRIVRMDLAVESTCNNLFCAGERIFSFNRVSTFFPDIGKTVALHREFTNKTYEFKAESMHDKK